MKPRHVAQIRLARTIPGETCTDPRALPARLEERSTRDTLGSSEMVERPVTLWDRRPVPLSRFRMPELGRPTPLLKRLVRHPISLDPGTPARRVDVFDASRPAASAPSREPVAVAFSLPRTSRAREGLEQHAPSFRPAPFVRRRAAGLDAEDRP